MLKKYLKRKLDRYLEPKIKAIEHNIRIYFKSELERVNIKIDNLDKKNSELLWAQIWNDTKVDIDWIQGVKSLSPGRAAVGYNYLYVMTRVLTELEPHTILDMGLGISSSLISSYLEYYNFNDAYHMIIEQDKSWEMYYLRKHTLSSYSQIFLCPCIEKEYKGIKYNAYSGFAELVKDKKFSVISIDGPIGSKEYSRRDILDVLPTILEKSFVILLDDSQRKGETNTIIEIKRILDKNNIKYKIGNYRGETDCSVIASEDYKFLCSL